MLGGGGSLFLCPWVGSQTLKLNLERSCGLAASSIVGDTNISEIPTNSTDEFYSREREVRCTRLLNYKFLVLRTLKFPHKQNEFLQRRTQDV